MLNFVLDFWSRCLCYRKMVFILLFSESRRLLCNKNLSYATISWGQFLTQQILDESWSHWYQNDPEGPEILKILKSFRNSIYKWVKLMQKVGNLRFFMKLPDAKTGSNWSSFCSWSGPGKKFYLGGLR